MFDVVGEDLGVIRLLFDVFQFVRIVPCSYSFTVILLRLGRVSIESRTTKI